MTQTNKITISPIGFVNSPYKEKFAIPRQPGLVNAAKGTITLLNEINPIDCIRELEQFSHIWILFIFHCTQSQSWKPLVRPPRLGGNKKVGVLASRSTFRPNPIGMSVVKLDKIERIKQTVTIHISGMDLLDQTPIVDIKPYIPYSDSLPNAYAGYAQTAPKPPLKVSFSERAQQTLTKYENILPDLALLIKQVLSQDPRPAYKQKQLDYKSYGMRLYDLNVQWQILNSNTIQVTQIAPY